MTFYIFARSIERAFFIPIFGVFMQQRRLFSLLHCTFNNVLCKIFVSLKKNVDICTINQSHINNL